MRIAGERTIEASRHETFNLGRNPDAWRRASCEGPLYIQPRETTPFKQGDVVDIAIDTSTMDLPWLVRKVIGKRPLEAEALIATMEHNKRIQITGDIAILGFGLNIVLHDSHLGDNHTAPSHQTFVEYGLDLEALGPLSKFSGKIGGIEPVLQAGADRLIENLAFDIETANRGAA